MRRGEVWWAELAPRSGGEQRGRRPVVVVSHDAFNAVDGWRSVIVVPLTTRERQRRVGPTAVAFPAGTAGLPIASVALCHQITALDRAKLVDHVGALPAEGLLRLEHGVLAALDLRVGVQFAIVHTQLETLRAYLETLGGELEVSARFGDERILIAG